MTRTCNVSNPPWDKRKFRTCFRTRSGVARIVRALQNKDTSLRFEWGSIEVRTWAEFPIFEPLGYVLLICLKFVCQHFLAISVSSWTFRKSDQEWRGQRARGSRKLIFRANFIWVASEHCAAAFFTQGAKNYTEVRLDLLYRLILGTYIIIVRENNFLSPSVYCPDTSKRVPQIVTATETEWRNWFVRDWIETKRAKNHDTLRDLKWILFFVLQSKILRETRFFFDRLKRLGRS